MGERGGWDWEKSVSRNHFTSQRIAHDGIGSDTVFIFIFVYLLVYLHLIKSNEVMCLISSFILTTQPGLKCLIAEVH